MEEWKNKIGPAQQSANLERYENVNQRTLAYQQMSMELREKAQEAKEKNDQRRVDILQQRADLYRLRYEHPDFKFMFPKGGNVQVGNPRTGEMHDTGVPTGSASDIDKITLGQENALERISATGEQARQTEDVRQTGRLEAIGARGTQARETRATPAGGTGKAELPTQTRIRQFNAAREIMNSRPDLAKFIKLGTPGANDFKVTPPGQNFWGEPNGPSKEQANEINRLIYGTGTTASHAPTSAAKPPVAPPGWKYVAKPGGGWTAVPDTGIQ